MRTVISFRFKLPELDNSSSIRKVLRTTGTKYRPLLALRVRWVFLARITEYYRTFQLRNTRERLLILITPHYGKAQTCREHRSSVIRLAHEFHGRFIY